VIFGAYFVYNAFSYYKNVASMSSVRREQVDSRSEGRRPRFGGADRLGGLSLLLGVRPKVGASLIGVFLLRVTSVMHNFWTLKTHRKLQERVNFLKNVAFSGAQPWRQLSLEPGP
jgi:hypothetical protein